MPASKQLRTRSVRQATKWGLAAIGTSGPWQVDIDQSLSGRSRWEVEIEGPTVYVRFEIPAIEIIERAVRFLSEVPQKNRRNALNGENSSSLVLSKARSPRICLIRDDEFADRYFLLAHTENGPTIRFTLTGGVLTHLIAALRQALEDIDVE